MLLTKRDPASPALFVKGRDIVAIKAGTTFCGVAFGDDAPVALPVSGLKVGTDYGVVLVAGVPTAVELTAAPTEDALGGFHFAPGGNASARQGGDDQPAVNPCSLWDQHFRPACPDPRGMALVSTPGRQFWCDIYLTGVDHLINGTSRFGVTLADGNDPPQDPAGGKFRKFDYPTAVAVMAHHGKGLLSVEEFFAAAFGVTEKTARDGDPETTKLDAPRTSKFGLMQATGNLWVWGHDGDPDTPRPSIFGGSWWDVGSAGSRCAHVGYWLGYSVEYLGARGRSDHLQLV